MNSLWKNLKELSRPCLKHTFLLLPRFFFFWFFFWWLEIIGGRTGHSWIIQWTILHWCLLRIGSTWSPHHPTLSSGTSEIWKWQVPFGTRLVFELERPAFYVVIYRVVCHAGSLMGGPLENQVSASALSMDYVSHKPMQSGLLIDVDNNGLPWLVGSAEQNIACFSFTVRL